ncbi:MAG: GTPase ObgE [Dehalococcoidia bacterium]
MIDHVEIQVRGGSGGNGCVSFRREKFVPKGGPNGGDGGDGGVVVIVADAGLNTLGTVKRGSLYKGEDGGNGRGSGRKGKRGRDTVVLVPVGTEVRRVSETGEAKLLADLKEAGAKAIVARGGVGGWGNARFATATHQAPRIAQRGLPGERQTLVLELKIVADVGITGLPNVGKSSLLTAISAARPKVADYPFTTLEPTLGVVEIGYDRFVAADIPGLIEGAHLGAGLGLDFLRHIERTRVLLYLLDGSRPDVVADMKALDAELAQYSSKLLDKQRVVAVNKVDLPEVRAAVPKIRGDINAEGKEPLFVSALSGEGLDDLIQRLVEMVKREREQEPSEEMRPETVGARPRDRRFSVSRDDDGVFRVAGEAVVAFATMMPLGSEEGRAVFWRMIGRRGVVGALRRGGAAPGDRVRFGEVEVEWLG